MKKRIKRKKSAKAGVSSILGMHPLGWIIIFTLLAVFSGIMFLRIQDTTPPPTVETITAEVKEVWVQEYQSDSGGYRIYRVRLKQEEREFTCRLSFLISNRFPLLETGQSYQFSISRTRSRCFVRAF